MKAAKKIIGIFNSDLEMPSLTPALVRSLYTKLYRINTHTTRSGLCVMVNLTRNEHILLKAIFVHWPEFSGIKDYPIKAPAYLGMSPSGAYFFFSETGSMWHKDAIYGAARRRLHSFCLYVLEDLLQYYMQVGSYTLKSSK